MPQTTDSTKHLINEIMNPSEPLRGWAVYRSGQEVAAHLFANVLKIPSKYGNFLGVEEVVSTFGSDQLAFGQVIERYEAKVNEANKNEDLSQAGKQKIKDKALADALKEVDALQALPDYPGEIARKTAKIEGAYLGARERNMPKDPTAQAILGVEMRATAERYRQEALAKGDKSDPVEKLLQEAVSTYDESREPFLRAVLTPPFPLQVISPEMKSQVEEALKAKISPELSQKLNYQKDYSRVHAELADAAREAVAGRPRGGKPRVVTE